MSDQAADDIEAEKRALEAEAEGAYEDQQSSAPIMVDGMVTPLNYDEEMVPFAGPPVIDAPIDPEDPRPLFVSLGLFTDGRMPGEALQSAYYEWLEQCAETEEQAEQKKEAVPAWTGQAAETSGVLEVEAELSAEALCGPQPQRS